MLNSSLVKQFSSKLTVYLFNCIFIAFIIYFISSSVGIAHLGIEGGFVNDKWIIMSVDPGGYGAGLGISPGDQVLAVDDVPLIESRSLNTWHRFSAKDTVTIQKSDKHLQKLKIDISLNKILIDFLPMLSVGLAFWLFANYVIYSKPYWELSKAIYFFNYSIALVLISIHAVSRNIPLSRDVELIGILMTPPLLTYLIWVLPHKSRWSNPRFIGMALPGLIIFLLHYIWTTILWKWIDLYSLIQSLILVYVICWGLVCTISIFFRYHKADQVTRNQIGILLWCTVTGILPLLCLTVVPTLIYKKPFVQIEYSVISVALIPLAMWYVLSKEKIFDLSFFIRHGTSYVILGFPALVFYSWLLDLLYGGNVLDVWWKALAFLIANIIIIASYSTWKETLEASIEKQLFKDSYERKRLLKDFQKTILKIQDPDLLISSLLDVVSNSLRIEDLCICLKEHHVYFVKANRGRCKDKRMQAAILSYAGEHLTGISEPVQLPKYLGMEYAVPVLSDEGVTGVLFLGLKNTRIKFSQEDIITVRSLLDNFSIALDNSKLLASTRKQFDSALKEIALISKSSTENKWLNRMLVSAQEEERRKLSSDLHDGPVQLLVQLIRNCQQFAETDIIQPAQFRNKTLETCEIAKDILYDLRELCFRLRPALLDDLGLIPTLEWLIAEVKRNSNIEIDFKLDCKNENILIDKEVELVIFRVVQEIINNTLKHAQATNLNINLCIYQNRVVLNTCDNGIGFNTTDLLDNLQGNRFGLLGMKKRVTWVGGTFQLSSTPKVGTSIRVSIPNQPMEGRNTQWQA